jgi:hypothetical protein
MGPTAREKIARQSKKNREEKLRKMSAEKKTNESTESARNHGRDF